MARSADRHLASDELEALAPSSAITKAESLTPEIDLEEVQGHLSICEDCRARLEQYVSTGTRLAGLRVVTASPRGVDCPPDGEWLLLAAGLLPAIEAEKNVQHASECDHCGPLLQRAMEDFSEELTPEEEAVLASLQSTDRGWQQRVAARLSAASRNAAPERYGSQRWWQTFTLWPRWAISTAVVVLLAVGAWWLVRPMPQRTAQRLLAEAYTQQRTMELRIPGAGYATLHVERGGDARSAETAALLEAKALIARKLSEHPRDPFWLQTGARADLLDWRYEPAIRRLERAREAEPDSPDILTDLALAYFERAEAEDRAVDYGTAIELLGRALAKRPDAPVALFNRAIVYERIYLYQQAIEDWQHYLRLDPDGGWASEARHHLNELLEKVKTHGQFSAPSANPAAAVRPLHERAEGRWPKSAAWPESRDEEYLDLAVTEWLPSLYLPTKGRGLPQPAAAPQAALAELACVLRDQHGDPWLADLLASRPSPQFVSGLMALGKAVRASAAGNPDDAERLAGEAERLFRASGSPAGVLRAQIERVYALQRAQRADRCLTALRGLARQANSRRYVWLEAQAHLEKSSCTSMVGDLDGAVRAVNQALAVTQGANYATLLLRCLGFVAALDTDKGDVQGAWSQDRAGLTRYWQGFYPPLRAYQFYSDLNSAAEESGQWRLALAIARETVTKVVPTPNRSLEALARHRLGIAASMAGETSQATKEFERAGELFAGLPQSPAIRAYQASVEIALASIETERGEFDRSYARLNRLRPELPQISNYLTALRFYGTLGVLGLRRGENERAESSLRAAVRISEQGLGSLTNDPDRLAWDRETGRVYRSLVRLRFLNQGDAKGALQAWEWYRATPLRSSLAFAADSHRAAPRTEVSAVSLGEAEAAAVLPPMKEISDLLRFLSQETVISYALFPEGLVIWVFDDRGLHVAWEATSTAEVERLALRFAGECSDRTSDLVSLQRDARRLYQILLAPVASHLDPSRVFVVEADGAIGYVPFQALVDADGKYFGADHATLYSPGIEYMLRLRDAGEISPQLHALVVGSPTLARGTAALPLAETAAEAREVASRFDRATLLLGKEATRAALEDRLASAEVFHFAGHAISGARRAGLVLAISEHADESDAEGAVLMNAARFDGVRLKRCRLAVFSACSTGTGERGGLVDPNSLVRAFLLARVPHVVASRWNVDSTATAAFMRSFYGTLLTPTTTAGALQAAANQIRRRPDTAHPYYWAAFSLFGRN